MALAASLVSTVLKKTEAEPLKEIFKNINIMYMINLIQLAKSLRWPVARVSVDYQLNKSDSAWQVWKCQDCDYFVQDERVLCVRALSKDCACTSAVKR